MFRWFRVRGDSMYPEYRSSDYLLVMRPLWRRLRPGDDVVSRHPVFGTVFKRIRGLEGDRLWLCGLNPRSTSSTELGSVSRGAVLGRVILHVRAPRQAAARRRSGVKLP